MKKKRDKIYRALAPRSVKPFFPPPRPFHRALSYNSSLTDLCWNFRDLNCFKYHRHIEMEEEEGISRSRSLFRPGIFQYFFRTLYFSWENFATLKFILYLFFFRPIKKILLFLFIYYNYAPQSTFLLPNLKYFLDPSKFLRASKFLRKFSHSLKFAPSGYPVERNYRSLKIQHFEHSPYDESWSRASRWVHSRCFRMTSAGSS